MVDYGWRIKQRRKNRFIRNIATGVVAIGVGLYCYGNSVDEVITTTVDYTGYRDSEGVFYTRQGKFPISNSVKNPRDELRDLNIQLENSLTGVVEGVKVRLEILNWSDEIKFAGLDTTSK